MAGKKSKPLNRRMYLINKLLKEKKYPNAESIASHHGIECSTRTIKRVIEYMRDELNAPIEYDRTKKGYYYSEPMYELPSYIGISKGEIFSLLIAKHILVQYRNTPIYPKLNNIFTQIEELLPTEITIQNVWLDNNFSITSFPDIKIDEGIWNTLFEAFKSNTKVLMWYKTPGYDEAAKRMLAPYHVICSNTRWYVIGHDSYSSDIRLFALHRIQTIKPTKFKYSIPEEFNYKNYIDSSFGMYIEDELHDVELLFAEDVAPLIEEGEWHENQQIVKKKDGNLILKFQTRQLTSTMHWVLSWGDNVKVRSPDKLTEMIKETLKSAYDQY